MAGVRYMPGENGSTVAAGMKRSFSGEARALAYGEPHPKKRRILHKVQHAQPTQHIIEPINAEFDVGNGSEYKNFFHDQLRRAIAIQCKADGFDGATPEGMQFFTAMVDEFMRNFLAEVRTSMTMGRRISPVAHDWVKALMTTGNFGSSSLDFHLNTSALPPTLLQPPFGPPALPEQPDVPPESIEGMIGAELSGRAEKESKKHIPSHFPPFPSKHTWKSTSVFTQRENDPRKIREKATEEGIIAEQSLRRLMAAQKKGLQGTKVKKVKQSKKRNGSDQLWQSAMKQMTAEEEERARKERQRRAEDEDMIELELDPQSQRRLNLEEGVHANYDRKFGRQSTRGAGSG
ncbi:hypothetical protein EJ04DRAFT_502764 [Polyplosphaeria fusca]|uniref:Transcription initiation factor TFIID subunit 8 n=1 Tax=Polyplosphaeria fusca TaxID=682080 RepID=A0A9P4UWC9_9PLEO|nr:hypothetical protein EJ04DRAFT_502764 [Polyplosphaeria fusca]